MWPLVCAFLLDFFVTSKATKKNPACCECSLAESGFFFVCRSEDNFKDNSPHCVLPSCSLFLSVFGFVLCFLCPFFSTLFFCVDFSALWSFSWCSFPSLFLLYSAFYKAPKSLPLKPVLALQDCYPSTNGIVGRERGHDWVGFAADFPASLLNRNEEDTRLFPNHGVVSTGMEIFTLTPNQFNLNNWDPNQ